MHKHGCAVMWCLSVCVSDTFVYHVKTNKHIFKMFSPSGSHTILVFPYQMGWRNSDKNPPNGGVECRWGRQKTRFWTNSWLRCIQVYSVVNCTSHKVWKTKPRRTEVSVEHSNTAASVVRYSHKTTMKCLWRVSTLDAGDEGRSTPRSPAVPPRDNPPWS